MVLPPEWVGETKRVAKQEMVIENKGGWVRKEKSVLNVKGVKLRGIFQYALQMSPHVLFWVAPERRN